MKKIMQYAIEFKTWACLSFTAVVFVYTVCGLAFGEKSMEFVRIFQLAGLSIGATLLQFAFFSGKVIKKMRYSLRMLLFAVPMLGLIFLFALLCGWVPQGNPYAWIGFLITFLLAFIVITVGFEVYFYVTGKKYDGLLGQYQKRKDGKQA